MTSVGCAEAGLHSILSARPLQQLSRLGGGHSRWLPHPPLAGKPLAFMFAYPESCLLSTCRQARAVSDCLLSSPALPCNVHAGELNCSAPLNAYIGRTSQLAALCCLDMTFQQPSTSVCLCVQCWDLKLGQAFSWCVLSGTHCPLLRAGSRRAGYLGCTRQTQCVDGIFQEVGLGEPGCFWGMLVMHVHSKFACLSEGACCCKVGLLLCCLRVTCKVLLCLLTATEACTSGLGLTILVHHGWACAFYGGNVRDSRGFAAPTPR